VISKIDEGGALVERALRHGRPGSYQLQAAIAAVHDEAATTGQTDWPQIALLYRELMAFAPSPVVELNQAVAVAMTDGPALGLAMVDALAAEGRLHDYVYLHATRADLLRRLGRRSEAAEAYEQALHLSTNATERRFLERRLAETRGGDEARPN
jgi:RNA polymerase sigma-70 factor (ECF subfamily)